jgi:hypothetical protein
MRFSSVVFPLPRKPVMMVAGIRGSSIEEEEVAEEKQRKEEEEEERGDPTETETDRLKCSTLLLLPEEGE